MILTFAIMSCSNRLTDEGGGCSVNNHEEKGKVIMGVPLNEQSSGIKLDHGGVTTTNERQVVLESDNSFALNTASAGEDINHENIAIGEKGSDDQ